MPQKGPDTVKALIKSEHRLMSYSQHPGLTLVEPDKGAVTWSIFSGPTKKYQTDYDFYKYAFTIIGTGKTINDAVIALYNTDIRTPSSIQYIASYNLLTGMKVKPQVGASTTTPTIKDLQKKLYKTYTSISKLLSEVTRLNESLPQRKAGRRS